MNLFFTADPHFNHMNEKGGIIKYSNRPFADINEMNETLVRNWNSVVGPNDLTRIVGDFALYMTREDQRNLVVSRLNGRKILIHGNHDHLKLNGYLGIGFEDYKFFEFFEDLFISHFPIYPEEYITEDVMKRGGADVSRTVRAFRKVKDAFAGSGFTKVVHGHIHNLTYQCEGLQHVNVGVDVNNFTPVSYDEVKEKFRLMI